MPVLCLHFQTNAPSYASNTEKRIGVASMLSGDALDWFGKATAEDVEFCLDYAKFEAELMATGEDCGIVANPEWIRRKIVHLGIKRWNNCAIAPQF
ncbi:hypothetical protein DSO57_1004519 [Entomophthora muscae]|uniref:Uncharacterized protein n=1 Tax=Entomophthora muscae TaxID=34485 RepID=A0ACC2RN25_9FUNG|nr:hypothetical protein DSO57_1004519 [Entomophthora muscae]